MNKSIKIFSRLIFLSIIVTYLVILAGSIVRATGSGMGCPDWPKCFGQYIPPTDLSQLPKNYKEVFKVQGKEIADFNALHTWVEYINRLLGVVMGFLVLGVLIFSFLVRKEFSKMYIFSGVVFLATLFQAWLGAKVVSSNLAPLKITIHMVFALIILAAFEKFNVNDIIIRLINLHFLLLIIFFFKKCLEIKFSHINKKIIKIISLLILI